VAYDLVPENCYSKHASVAVLSEGLQVDYDLVQRALLLRILKAYQATLHRLSNQSIIQSSSVSQVQYLQTITRAMLDRTSNKTVQ